MNIKAVRLISLSIVVTISTRFAGAQPADFPGFTVTTCNTNAFAPGSIFLPATDPGNKHSWKSKSK